MKKYLSLLPFAFVIAVAFTVTGCKKCYHCYNTCVLCQRTDTVSRNGLPDTLIVINNLHCTDLVASQADHEQAIKNDSSLGGFVCNKAEPTYEQDFCVNKPGDPQYTNYYDKGGRAKCDLK